MPVYSVPITTPNSSRISHEPNDRRSRSFMLARGRRVTDRIVGSRLTMNQMPTP
jgi:hypothetical protein